MEDDESVRLTLEGVLEMDGHRITTATTVDEALAQLDVGHFQAVISDFQLNDDSGRTGLHVLAEATRRAPESTTILVTGYPSAQLMEAARSQPVTTTLIKPYPLEDLKAALAGQPPAD